MLEVGAAFDNRRLWADDGATSMAAWLVARLGVSHGTATAGWEITDRLRRLPLLAGAFEEGRLSWDQVRAAAEIATVGTEEKVLAEALGSSAARLERAARRRREICRRGGEAVRSVRWWWERRGVQWRLSGYLPAEEGAWAGAGSVAASDRGYLGSRQGVVFLPRLSDDDTQPPDRHGASGSLSPATDRAAPRSSC